MRKYIEISMWVFSIIGMSCAFLFASSCSKTTASDNTAPYRHVVNFNIVDANRVRSIGFYDPTYGVYCVRNSYNSTDWSCAAVKSTTGDSQ